MEGEEWTLKLKATSSTSTTSPDNVVEYQFNMALIDGCTIDELSSPSTIVNFVYYIDDTGLKEIETPTYT